MEQSAIYDQLDSDAGSYGDLPNYRVGANFISAYTCPSDPAGQRLVGCCTKSASEGNGPTQDEDLAINNFSGVADSRDWQCGGRLPRPDGNGMLFNSSHVKIAEVSDGTSNTLFVGEIPSVKSTNSSTGLPVESGQFWLTWNVMSTQNGINLPLRLGTDATPWNVNLYSFGSHHPGGCHFLYADGSSHFVVETISQHTLEALTTRAGGETIDTLAE